MSSSAQPKHLTDLILTDLEQWFAWSPSVHYIAEPYGSYARVFVSAGVKELTGHESVQFTRHPKFWANHIHPEDQPRVFADLEKAVENVRQTHSYRFKLADRTWGWIRDDWRLITTADGKSKAIIGSWLDITAHREMEVALRESEKKYRDLIEGSIQGILIHCDGKAVFANQAYADIFGYANPGQILAEGSVWDHVAPHERERMRAYRDARLRGEDVPVSYEFEGIRRDGSHIWLENRGHAISWGGRPAILRTVVDVTKRKESEVKLRGTSERLQMLIESSPLAIYTRDPNGLLTSWNPAAEQMYGWKRSEVLGKPLPSVPESDRAASDALRYRLLAGETFRYEARRRRRDGSPIDIDAFVGPLRDDTGNINGIIAVAADITERKRAEKRLQESESQLRLITDNVPATIAYFDKDLRYRFANAQYMRIFAPDTGNVLGKHLRDIIGDAVFEKIQGHLHEALEGRRVSYDRVGRGEGGEDRNIEITLVPDLADDGEVRGFFSLGNDVTELRLKQARIEHLAHHDTLTGLANRALLYDRLRQAIAAARREAYELAVLYLDLDKFKEANDALGHAAGDELLKQAAQRIARSVRESDTVARIGGDEFVVVLSKIASPDGAATVAGKIIAALAAPFHLGSVKQEVSIGASVGVALYTDETRDADELLKAADSAMYEAKRVGNSFRYFGD